MVWIQIRNSNRNICCCCCWFTSNDPGRVSQDVSGSGCGPAAGWFWSRDRPRRSPPYSLCGFSMRFWNCSLYSIFLYLPGSRSRPPRLCLRRNSSLFLVSLLVASSLMGLPHFWLSWWKHPPSETKWCCPLYQIRGWFWMPGAYRLGGGVPLALSGLSLSVSLHRWRPFPKSTLEPE